MQLSTYFGSGVLQSGRPKGQVLGSVDQAVDRQPKRSENDHWPIDR